MAFTRPTLPELVARIEPDFVSRLNLAGALLRRSVTSVLARVLAGASHMLHGHIDWASRQIFPDTADTENLLRHGRLRGVQPTEPAFAHGTVIATGTDTSVVTAGSILVRDDGAQYTVDADGTIASGVVALDVTAVVADENSNTISGTELTFQSPIAGVDATATVSVDQIIDGADEEDQASYLTRVLERIQSAPHGGASADYVAWAKEVSGVTRAWPYPKENGAGTVVVRVMRDNDSGSPFPSGGEITTIQDYIRSKAPVTATVTVLAPTPVTVNYTLAVVPNTQATKDAVSAELADLHQRVPEPGTTLLLASIRTAIGIGVGDGGTYTLATPSADVTCTAGQLAGLGTITFT